MGVHAALAIFADFDIGWATIFGVAMRLLSLGSAGVGFWLLSIINKRGEAIPTIAVDQDHLDEEFKKLEDTEPTNDK